MKNMYFSQLFSHIPRQSTFKGIAVVSGIFSFIVMILLAANQIALQKGLPDKERIYSAELTEKMLLLDQDPQNQTLKEEIRQLDLELRQEFFARNAFASRGKYLLLFGVVVWLLSMKQLIFFPKPSRKRKKEDPPIDHEGINKKQARLAVTGIAVLVLVIVLPFAYGTRASLPSLVSDQESVQIAYPTQEEIQQNWHRFRGPGGLGIVHSENIPTYWNEDTGEGILWKSEIPLPGNGSPIVWGDRIFLSGGDDTDKAIFCYSAETGELLWQQSLQDISQLTDQVLRVFADTGYAASTMATDGTRVYAMFADGTIGAYDFEGNRIWAKHLGIPDNMYGFAASLICYQHNVIVQNDQSDPTSGKSVLYSFDGATGNVTWQAQRDVGSSWTTPIIIETETEKQLITCSEPWVISYNPDDGTERWRADLLGMDLATSPIFANGLVFAVQSNSALFAILPDGSGDVTDTHVVMDLDCPAPEISSPISNGEFVFLLSGGYLACHSTEDGELLWEHDLEDIFTASPSIVGEWIYLISEEGVTYRMKAAAEAEMAEQNAIIHDRVFASLAFQDNRIFIRGEMYLYGIGEQ